MCQKYNKENCMVSSSLPFGMWETKQCEEIPTLNVLTVIYKL